MSDNIKENSRRRRTPAQKRILKKLIDHDLRLEDIANFHGHTTSNASTHLLRENEDYFLDAINEMRAHSIAS